MSSKIILSKNQNVSRQKDRLLQESKRPRNQFLGRKNVQKLRIEMIQPHSNVLGKPASKHMLFSRFSILKK